MPFILALKVDVDWSRRQQSPAVNAGLTRVGVCLKQPLRVNSDRRVSRLRRLLSSPEQSLLVGWVGWIWYGHDATYVSLDKEASTHT